MTKQSRHQAILERLRGECGASIGDLARELNVSTKTIQRDLANLAHFGVRKNGRMLVLDKSLAQDGLNSDERVILGILSKLARNNGIDFYLRAAPLLERITQQLDQPIFIATQSESLSEADLANFSIIEGAITARREIAFLYRKNGKSYQIKPLKLAHFDGFWYVMCLDSRKNDTFKKFYFKDITRIEVLECEFCADPKIEDVIKNANSAWFSLAPPFLVQLQIAKEIAPYFTRKNIKGASIIPQRDKSLILEMQIANEMQIKPLVFAYIPHIRVISPSWLNEKFKREILDFGGSL